MIDHISIAVSDLARSTAFYDAVLAPLELKSWPAADVLAASEIRVLVDAGGYVVSAVLLGDG